MEKEDIIKVIKNKIKDLEYETMIHEMNWSQGSMTYSAYMCGEGREIIRELEFMKDLLTMVEKL